MLHKDEYRKGSVEGKISGRGCQKDLTPEQTAWRSVGSGPPCREDFSAEAEESPLLEAVTRGQQAGKDLAGVVVICKAWRSAMAL
jgi:hypothetical protein